MTKISSTENNNVGATFDNLFIHIISFAQWCNETNVTEYSPQDAA